MVLVSKDKICVGRVEYPIQIFVDVRDGLFRIDLPNEIVELIHEREVRSQTMNGVIKVFRDKVASALTATVEKKKVIWYWVETQHGEFKNGYSRQEKQITRLGIFYIVVMKYYVNDDCKEYELSDYEKNGANADELQWMSNKKEIDWTPQREEFFKRFTASVQSLINRIEVFTKDDAIFVQAIDNAKMPLFIEGSTYEKVEK